MEKRQVPGSDGENREEEFVYIGQDTVHVVSNEQLECAGCIHALPQTGFCKKYRPKPGYVLLNKGPCPSFEAAGSDPALSDPDGHSSIVTHTPQCVGCVHNLGGFDCTVFVKKPEELLMNERVCPARQPQEDRL